MPDFLDDPLILRAVVDMAPDLVALSDFSGSVRYVNPAGRALVGLDDIGQDQPLTTVDFFTPGGLVRAAEVEHDLATRGHWHGRSELRHFVTGAPIPVVITTFVVHRAGDVPSVIASIVRDRRRSVQRDVLLEAAAATARQHAAEQKAVADLSRVAIDADLAQLSIAATLAATTLMGVRDAVITRADGDDLVLDTRTGKTVPGPVIPGGTRSLIGFSSVVDDVVVCDDLADETRFDTTAMADDGLRSGVAVPIAGSSGPWGYLSVHSAEVRHYGDNDVTFLMSIAAVLSTAIRRVELDRELRNRSVHDPLTGLPNRTLAYQRIDQALERAERDGSVIAVLLLDIDDFKIINDSLGHEAGDLALEVFAERLRASVPAHDTVARLGGDEFLIVFDSVDGISHARRLAEEITAKIAAFSLDQSALSPVSASIGVAVSEPGSTRRELIHRADLAMYRAKDAGSGGHAVFDDDDVYDAQRIRTLSIDLRAALGRGELTLVYQPLVDITTGAVVAAEALARWQHPEHGVVSPTEFVAVAERTGLAMELGRWSLTEACAQAARWRKTSSIDVRVNVSGLQLRDPEFPTVVERVLSDTGLPPSALGLEITETVWVSDTASVANTLKTLHELGVSILLDDLGKGHSSISYLDRYPMFECFKIDKSYIAALPGRRAEAIVAAIVALAKAFDVTVVGEGVETAEQFEALRACGADLAQGFHLGRPVTAEEFVRGLGAKATR